jgi:ABC-type tungstate transport system permease subunit
MPQYFLKVLIMKHLELLGCDEKIHRMKIILAIVNNTKVNSKEAKEMVDFLFLNKSINLILDFDIQKCNEFAMSLAELGVRIGYTSWHEENR